jgi:putative transcriptional regulator
VKNTVRELRVRLGWTQQELGAHVGASRQAIIAIENGRFDPSLPLAIKLSRVLKKSIEEIFFLDD